MIINACIIPTLHILCFYRNNFVYQQNSTASNQNEKKSVSWQWHCATSCKPIICFKQFAIFICYIFQNSDCFDVMDQWLFNTVTYANSVKSFFFFLIWHVKNCELTLVFFFVSFFVSFALFIRLFFLSGLRKQVT